MPLHAAATAFGDLMLGDRAEEPRRRPALLVGTLGERRPELFDCRQSQLVEHQRELCDINTLVHAISSARGARSRSEEHTSELQSLMRISYAVFCLKKKKLHTDQNESTARTNTSK